MTHRDHLKALDRARGTLVYRLQILEQLFGSEPTDGRDIEDLKARIAAIDWATRVVRAALVVLEERTPEGVSDTLLDLLQKAAG